MTLNTICIIMALFSLISLIVTVGIAELLYSFLSVDCVDKICGGWIFGGFIFCMLYWIPK